MDTTRVNECINKQYTHTHTCTCILLPTFSFSSPTDPTMMESMPVSYASTMGGMMGHYFSGGTAAGMGVGAGVGQLPPAHHSNPHAQQQQQQQQQQPQQPQQQPPPQQEATHPHQQATHPSHTPAQSPPEVIIVILTCACIIIISPYINNSYYDIYRPQYLEFSEIIQWMISLSTFQGRHTVTPAHREIISW